MVCLNPLYAVSVGRNKIGKHQLAFLGSHEAYIAHLKNNHGSDNVFLLPCGQCEACRINYAKEWSIRCCLEACEHEFNYFLTLTFDNNHVKYAGNKDLNKFIDRLQKYDPNLKYFACKEFGSLTNRIHFHMILFMDKELELIEPVKIGDYYHFHCPMISKKWNFGLHDITPFERDCAAYVAKYANKDNQPVFSRKERRIFMSRNLGYKYFDKHFIDIFANDFKVYGDFGKKKVIDLPKCFIRWYEEKFGVDMTSYKEAIKSSQKDRIVSRMLSSHCFKEEDFLDNSRFYFKKHYKGDLRNGSF